MSVNPLFGQRSSPIHADVFTLTRKRHYESMISLEKRKLQKHKASDYNQGLWLEFSTEVAGRVFGEASLLLMHQVIEKFVEAFLIQFPSFSRDYNVDNKATAEIVFDHLKPGQNQEEAFDIAIAKTLANQILDMPRFSDNLFGTTSPAWSGNSISRQARIVRKNMLESAGNKKQEIIDQYAFSVARLVPSLETKGQDSLLENIEFLWREAGWLTEPSWLGETLSKNKWDWSLSWDPGMVHILNTAGNAHCYASRGAIWAGEFKPSRIGRWDETLNCSVLRREQKAEGKSSVYACVACEDAVKKFDPASPTVQAINKALAMDRNWTPLDPTELDLVLAPLRTLVELAILDPFNHKLLIRRDQALRESHQELCKVFWQKVGACSSIEAWQSITGLSRAEVEAFDRSSQMPSRKLSATKIRFANPTKLTRLQTVARAELAS